MTHPAIATPLPVGTSIPQGSLRAEMEARRAEGVAFSVREALGLIVPLCTRLTALHAQGRRFFVHASSLRYSKGAGLDLVEERASTPPTLPRDRALLAPEARKGEPGDTRASVFAIGALLYELLTTASVGPGMRRPSEMVPGLDPRVETILGKALVADPRHRPGDLGALAQALHNAVPTASMMPPPADESHLDHDEDFEVDVRLSMIPPSAPVIPRAAPLPKIPGVHLTVDGPYPPVAVRKEHPSNPRASDPTQRLSDLKAALEADPRPRYVVVKSGMDHGPFSAVELLQQIASATFNGDHALRDVFSNEERAIKDWEEFAPFAEQARLNREIVQEKRALEAATVAEKQGTQYKVVVGAAVFLVLIAGGAGWWMRERANKDLRVGVQADEAVVVEVDGGLAAGAKKSGPAYAGGAAGPRPAGGGGLPVLSGGMSCERARSTYVEELKMGDNGPADITAGQYGSVLNKGSYLNACGVPSSMAVSICAAVQNGRAVGVTVTTNPSNPGVASCVAGQIRALSFPSNPRLDVTTTTFASQ